MARLPAHVSSLIAALKFRSADRDGLRKLTAPAWDDILRFSDMSHLTITLRHILGDDLPPRVRDRIDRNIADNAQRFQRTKETYAELAAEFKRAGVDYLVLKGFAQWPAHMQHPRFRMQSDVDLYCPPESASRAMDALSRLGYAPTQWELHSPGDQHLPAVSRPGNFQWKGNFFDPEMPLSVEVHTRFWNESTTYIYPAGLDQFWHRRTRGEVDEITFPAMDLMDRVGYSALHAFRHLLYTSSLAFHYYELAWFLHTTAADNSLWHSWKHRHDRSLRSIEAICFFIASQCFDCELPADVEEEIAQLPPPIRQWSAKCVDSALYGLFRPTKDSLWLHLSLIESAESRRTVLCKGVFGTRLTPLAAFDDPATPSSETPDVRSIVPKYCRYASHVVRRLFYHGSHLPSVLLNGIRWWWSTKELDSQFWTFYSASFCFDLGMFVFFFLFNLYLLDLGFTTKFLGLMTGAMAAGSIVGTLPAGRMAQRFGLRPTIVTCFVAVALLAGLRTVFVNPTLQLCLAFLGGMASCIWAVSISPALAQLTNPRNRAFGFSLVFSFGIGEGALGGLIAGNLPDWLRRLQPLATAADLKRTALLLASGTVLLAAWPAWKLRFSAVPPAEPKHYSKPQFLPRFLLVIGLWSLVTGAFAPFFNVFFVQHLGMAIRKVGTISAASQISQVFAILAAPYLFKKFGLVSGIMYTQIAAALALACLALLPGASAAALAYVGYMAFLWMSEPGMYGLLMNRIIPAERSGASALNFLVISVAQAIAAVIAGSCFDRYGYPAVLLATALVAIISAGCFRFLFGADTLSAFDESTRKLGLLAGSD